MARGGNDTLTEALTRSGKPQADKATQQRERDAGLARLEQVAKGPRPGLQQLKHTEAAAIIADYDRFQEIIASIRQLSASALLQENEAGDNISVTIPISAWRDFAETISFAKRSAKSSD